MTVEDRAGTAHLEPLPTLPVFFKLAGKRAVVAGGDQPTVWKAELLAATGAMVEVVAPEPCPALLHLAEDRGPAAVRLIARSWADQDLAGAAIAVGSMPTEQEARRFQQAAHRAGVPVNVIDKPAFCDFQFGTVVARSPLVLAITTDGAAPVLGQALRTRLEALLPQDLRAWASAAKTWRPRVEAYGWSFRRRRRFWDSFARQALAPGATMPDQQAFEACQSAAEAEIDARPTMVTLIGCGSGRPDDLTFSAARALLDADTVLYDPDVDARTIALARREAHKQAAAEENPLQQIQHLPPGSTVAWIGTGDPTRCPHWTNRREALRSMTVTLETGLRTCGRCARRCLGDRT